MLEALRVARGVVQVRAIAVTAFQETLRRKVFYLVAVLAIFIIAVLSSGRVLLQMATEAGEMGAAASMRSQMVQSILGIWQFAAIVLALFLGAVGVSSEITAKTIVNVLSRPVGRAVYLGGRWAGVLTFLWLFQLIGIVVALVVARLFDVRFVSTLWLGFAEMLVDTLLLSGISLGLSVFMPPVLAGAGAFLLQATPGLVKDYLQHPFWVVRIPAFVLYYLSPASMPSNLIEESFTKQLLHPNSSLYSQVLFQNLLYSAAVFIAACAIFARREPRLR
jgi:ABC-type transport system involved in multi-copper enzyme maturation permease subunit